MKSVFLKALAFALLVCSPSFGVELVPTIVGRHSTPVIAIWRENHGLRVENLGPHLITAIWSDGTAVWSNDNIRGGPQYYEGRVDIAVLEKLLQDCERDGAFSASYVRKVNFGVDSSFTTMFIASGNKTFSSSSWHELAEQNSGVVAASFGLTSLNGKTRQEFLKSDDQNYVKYRMLWEHLRTRIKAVLPKKGNKVTLSLEMK